MSKTNAGEELRCFLCGMKVLNQCEGEESTVVVNENRIRNSFYGLGERENITIVENRQSVCECVHARCKRILDRACADCGLPECECTGLAKMKSCFDEQIKQSLTKMIKILGK